MTKAVESELVDGIAIWRMNLVETRNAISDGNMIEELVELAEQAQANPDVRVVILTGNGPAFSSGGNVKKIRAEMTESNKTPHELANWYREGIQRIPLALYDLEVPVIAAVNGPAIGAGFDVSMMCDIRIGSTKARFGETFVNLGIIPGDGGAWFLPKALGHQRAAELTFTGRIVNAPEALEIGIVLEVVEPDELMPRVHELANEIAAKPPQALRIAKRLLRAGQSVPLPQFLDMCATLQAGCHFSDDHEEALNAFFEKRPGRYTGQ